MSARSVRLGRGVVSQQWCGLLLSALKPLARAQQLLLLVMVLLALGPAFRLATRCGPAWGTHRPTGCTEMAAAALDVTGGT